MERMIKQVKFYTLYIEWAKKPSESYYVGGGGIISREGGRLSDFFTDWKLEQMPMQTCSEQPNNEPSITCCDDYI